ncbi:hypothetical protein [Pseudoalteromonas piscicida]|uniref:hypothetical protein n=1 Tax=Pseudoalteromonas piscicida TaxID=43662 RepID=UPI0030B0FEB3
MLKSSLKGKAKYNDKYEVEISSKISLAPDLENANLIINECPTPCSAGDVWDAAARAKVGSGNVIEMVPWRANETTGAHELGHLLGLSHQPENSGSIMSYDANKSFSQHNDLKRLFDAYRRAGFE